MKDKNKIVDRNGSIFEYSSKVSSFGKLNVSLLLTLSRQT